MKYYFSADLRRQTELKGYAAELVARGDTVISSWLTEDFSAGFGKTTDEKRAVIARGCLEEVRDSNATILFTEPRGTAHIGGGRHFEAGYALGIGKRTIVIGHREHVFCCCPDVKFYESWAEFMKALAS